MIKKEITFENLDGEKVTRNFWFNLNKAELAKMQVRHQDFRSYIQAAIDSDNMERIIAVFDELLSLSYGVRDEDGVTFKKSEDLWDAFKNSDAYSELFIELLGNPKETGVFFAGLVPSQYREGVQDAMKKATSDVVDVKNLFTDDQDKPAYIAPKGEPTGEPTHEVPQPEAQPSGYDAYKAVSMSDRLANMSEEEKAALREALS